MLVADPSKWGTDFKINSGYNWGQPIVVGELYGTQEK